MVFTPDWIRTNFELFESSLNGQRGSALHQERSLAYSRLVASGLPMPQEEEWKYTNIAPLLEKGFKLPQKQSSHGAPARAALPSLADEEVSARLVFVNGQFSEELSRITPQEGLRISRLAENSDEPQVLQSLKSSRNEEQRILALNQSFMTDAVSISVAPNARITGAVEFVSVITEGGAESLVTPRLVIDIAHHGSITVVERHVGLSATRSLTAAVTSVSVGAEAALDYYKIGQESLAAGHLASFAAKVERGAQFRAHLFTFGGALVRNELFLDLVGQNSHSTLNGLTVLSGSQHVDNSTTMRHAEPNCDSVEEFRGVYAEASRGVFQGTIIVERDAQKTNAIQSNKTLLLSDKAGIDTKPQLKIWADDVKCTHGATVGQLDSEALFYLRARGISQKLAQAILTEAFAASVLESVRIDSLRAELRTLILQKLGITDHD